jgi:hypothetical protein
MAKSAKLLMTVSNTIPQKILECRKMVVEGNPVV